jgi:hypothetical protein
MGRGAKVRYCRTHGNASGLIAEGHRRGIGEGQCDG